MYTNNKEIFSDAYEYLLSLFQCASLDEMHGIITGLRFASAFPLSDSGLEIIREAYSITYDTMILDGENDIDAGYQFIDTIRGYMD